VEGAHRGYGVWKEVATVTNRERQPSSPDLEGRRLLIRNLTSADYEAVTALQLRCFPGMKPWLREQFESQIRTFPAGQICVELDGAIVASSASLVVTFDLHNEWHNWGEISDGGYIRNHDPKGDTLYGIEIMVDPAQRGLRLARRLYAARKEVAREMNLARIIIGGRIPGYGAVAASMSADEYVERVVSKELFDPVLTAQLANGFVLRRLIPGYLPSDGESQGYATFLEWTNYDYRSDNRRALRAVEIVRIAVVQYGMRAIESFEQFARQCEYFVDAGTENGCDFLVFPERLTLQLLSMAEPMRPGLAARSLDQFTARYVTLFGKLAIKYDVNILAGSHFVVEQGRLFNVAHLFHRDGHVSRQTQLHVSPSDRRWWGVQPGQDLHVFDTDRARIAILMSYDIQFPELGRIAAKKGAQLLLVPFSSANEDAYLRTRYCAQARAIENDVYVALAGSTGNLPFVDNADTHFSQSAIFTPCDLQFSRDGIAAQATANVEGVVAFDLDVELLRRHRYTGATQNLSDRRRDLYSIRYQSEADKKDV